MDIRAVSERFAVAPQIQPEDFRELAAQGYTAVVCNRPDGEEPGQPGVEEMRTAAQAAGIAFHHIPVSGGEFPDAAIAAFRAVRRGSDGRLLAYCRSGTRSITLDALANPEKLDPNTRITRAANAGYDLSSLSGTLN